MPETNSNRRERGVQAPGSIDQISYSTPELSEVSRDLAKQEKQELKQLTQSYGERLDASLRNAGLTQEELVGTKELFEHPLVKNEIITRASQMKGGSEKLDNLLQQFSEKKNDIQNALQERLKTQNSLKGKRVYWNTQLAKLTADVNTSAEKIKGVKDRIKALEKEERTLAKSRLDIDKYTPRIASAEEMAMDGISPEMTKQIRETQPSINSETRSPDTTDENLLDSRYGAHDEEMGFEAPPAMEPTKVEKKTPATDTMDSFSPDVKEQILDSQLKTFEVGGIEMGIKMDKGQYVLEFPETNMFFELGTDKARADKMIAFAIKEAGKLNNPSEKDREMFLDKIALVTSREQNLKETRAQETEPTASVEGQMQLGETDETQRAMEMPVITPDMLQTEQPTELHPEFAQFLKETAESEANDTPEYRHNSRVAELRSVIDSLGGEQNALSILEGAGVPKSILDKYKTLDGIIAFIEKPGFWSKLNGSFDKTEIAINKIIGSKGGAAEINPRSALGESLRENRLKTPSSLARENKDIGAINDVLQKQSTPEADFYLKQNEKGEYVVEMQEGGRTRTETLKAKSLKEAQAEFDRRMTHVEKGLLDHHIEERAMEIMDKQAEAGEPFSYLTAKEIAAAEQRKKDQETVNTKPSFWSGFKNLFKSSMTKEMERLQQELADQPDQLLGAKEGARSKGVIETVRHETTLGPSGTQTTEVSTPLGSRNEIASFGEKARKTQAELDKKQEAQRINSLLSEEAPEIPDVFARQTQKDETPDLVNEKPSLWSRFTNLFKESSQSGPEFGSNQEKVDFMDLNAVKSKLESLSKTNPREATQLMTDYVNVHKDEDPAKIARDLWNVDLNDANSVESLMLKLNGKGIAGQLESALISNLFRDHLTNKTPTTEAKPSRFENGMPGFGDWAADTVAKQKHAEEVYNATMGLLPEEDSEEPEIKNAA